MTENQALVNRNKAIRQWGNAAKAEMLTQIKTLGMNKGYGDTAAMLQARFSGNPIYSVGFRIPRHAIFAHKGVGKGYPINSISSGGTKGRFMRKPKPFLNTVLDKRLPLLADIVAEHGANIFTSQIFIK